VPQDPDVVLAPQRNGCRVEIVGGVAHSTSLEVRFLSLTVVSTVISIPGILIVANNCL